MAPQTAMRRSGTMDRKLLRVSSKRQITIPQAFFTKLGLSDQVDCILHGNELILRPVKRDTGGEFAEQILSDLIAEGFSGEDLLQKFKERQAQVRPAVETMIAQAEGAAQGTEAYESYEDVFGAGDDA